MTVGFANTVDFAEPPIQMQLCLLGSPVIWFEGGPAALLSLLGLAVHMVFFPIPVL